MRREWAALEPGRIQRSLKPLQRAVDHFRIRIDGSSPHPLRSLSSLAELCEELALTRGDGRHPRLIKSLGRADLLILDDFGLEPLDAGVRHDLLEVLEERYSHRSTIVTSQLPLSAWHDAIRDPTYADAILDRLAHNAHRIELAGESLRRARGKHAKMS